MNNKLSETSMLRKEGIHSLRSDSGADTNTNELTREKLCFALPGTEKACLRVVEGVARGSTLYLTEDNALIGREDQCDIRLLDQSISRKHARIIFQNEEFIIEDLDSTNGTYVNGIRIVKCVLRQNDMIQVGDVKMVFSEEVLLPE
jgi:hypothetical protein